MSIDQFYSLVTNDENAFYKLCGILPQVIDDIIQNETDINCIPQDTVLSELIQKNPDILKSLYLLAFESYNGFKAL